MSSCESFDEFSYLAVHQDSAVRMTVVAEPFHQRFGGGDEFFSLLFGQYHCCSLLSNKSPEPTRIVAFSDSLEVLVCHITGSGWLSFFR